MLERPEGEGWGTSRFRPRRKDGVFHWAKAKVEGSGVVVWCDEVKQRSRSVRLGGQPRWEPRGKNNLRRRPLGATSLVDKWPTMNDA
jgi:hypothetical protein